MQTRALYPAIFLLIFCAAAAAQSAEGQPSASELDTIIDRMMRAQEASKTQQRAYVVTRSYQVFGEDQSQPKTKVLAEVSFLPPDVKEYKIQKSEGSGQGAKAVRKILEHETDRTKDNNESRIGPENYNFTYLGQEMLEGGSTLVLGMEPKRKHKDLMIGKLWLDSQSYLIRRVEGRLSKSPSWWVRQVDVVLNYGDVSGIWMQTGTKAVANIRIFGKHTLVSRDLNCNVATQSARTTKPRRHTRPAAALGGFENVLRATP